MLQDDLENRVLDFDVAAADAATALAAERTRAGRPGDLRDRQIAGIAIALGPPLRRATCGISRTCGSALSILARLKVLLKREPAEILGLHNSRWSPGHERGYHRQVVAEHLRLLFWDIAIDRFNPGDYPVYTIERVLEYGDQRAVAWMRETFSRAQIVRVLETSRQLTPLSANFWALVFGVPRADVPALHGRP